IKEAWLVERHIVRGPLEPVEHLHWTAQRFEVALCQLRVDMAVVAGQGEEEGGLQRNLAERDKNNHNDRNRGRGTARAPTIPRSRCSAPPKASGALAPRRLRSTI